MEQRACDLALYVIESRGTVRSAAKKFGISKSTVHKDLSERLPAFNRGLYLQVKQVLEENKAQRHIRGGLATAGSIRANRSLPNIPSTGQTAIKRTKCRTDGRRMDQESRKNRRPPEFSSGGPAVFYVCRPFDAAAGTTAYRWVRRFTGGCSRLPPSAAVYRWVMQLTSYRRPDAWRG